VERTESVPSLVGTGQRLGLALLSVFIPSGSHRLVSSWSQTAIQADGDGQVKQLKAKDLLVPVGSRRRHKVKVLTDEAGADSNSFTVPVARNRNKFIEEDGCVDQPLSTASACFFYWVCSIRPWLRLAHITRTCTPSHPRHPPTAQNRTQLTAPVSSLQIQCAHRPCSKALLEKVSCTQNGDPQWPRDRGFQGA
jgi:hypothetical protein